VDDAITGRGPELGTGGARRWSGTGAEGLALDEGAAPTLETLVFVAESGPSASRGPGQFFEEFTGDLLEERDSKFS
jgi:hypothetical protein